MTKKRPAEVAARWERTQISPDKLEEMAEEIENFSKQFRTSARDMRILNVEEVVLATGNFDLAVKKLEGFVGNQLVPKVLQKAAQAGGRLKLVEFEPPADEPKKKR